MPPHNEVCKVFKNKGTPLWHLNVNSLLSKIEELTTLVFNTNISVLGITETKFDSNVNNDWLKVDDYNSLQSDRNKIVVGLLAALKRMLLIIDNQLVFLETWKILF